MSTAQGTSPRGNINVKDEPDHLLVLVHGIMGRYAYFLYMEEENENLFSVHENDLIENIWKIGSRRVFQISGINQISNGNKIKWMKVYGWH